jgi:small-conductance mechanosensitive channel
MTKELALQWFDALRTATGNDELSLILLFGGAMLGAIILHAIAFAVMRSPLPKDGVGRAILARMSGLTRLAAILLALVVVLPAAEIQPGAAAVVRQVLKIGAAIFLGWSVIVAINAAGRRVERRHKLDVEDNLLARRVHTQIEILRRIAVIIVVFLTAGAVLITFPAVQAFGVSLFASAGVAGIILGLAARPVLTNLIAGIQIALTQPIRIEDVLVVEGEWGWVEQITTTYVVIRIWDLRRLVVPLTYFVEKPFENWTRDTTTILGSVIWNLDYRTPIDAMRKKLEELAYKNPLWDGKIAKLQVVETTETSITVRGLVSARNSSNAWDLRCDVREQMISWLQTAHPEALPRVRALLGNSEDKRLHNDEAGTLPSMS